MRLELCKSWFWFLHTWVRLVASVELICVLKSIRNNLVIQLYRRYQHWKIWLAEGQLVTSSKHEWSSAAVRNCCYWRMFVCRRRTWWSQDYEYSRMFWPKEETVDFNDTYGNSPTWTRLEADNTLAIELGWVSSSDVLSLLAIEHLVYGYLLFFWSLLSSVECLAWKTASSFCWDDVITFFFDCYCILQ